MKKLNFPNLFVGQKCEFVGAPSESYKKGDKGKIQEIISCSCGIIYAGFNKCKYTPSHTTCGCGHRHPLSGYALRYSYNFKPIQEQDYPLMTFSEIREKEKTHVEPEILINN